MTVLLWLLPDTWPAGVAALAALTPGAVRLLAVVDDDTAAGVLAAGSGLLGRGRRAPTGATVLDEDAQALVDTASAELPTGWSGVGLVAHGRPETVVLDAAADADLLVCVRDGSDTHRGPRSLGRATRYVVDHAPCPVLLVWPGPAPGPVDLPPAPRPS